MRHSEDRSTEDRPGGFRPLDRVTSIKFKLSIVIVAAVAVAAAMSQVGLKLGWPVWIRPLIAAGVALIMAQLLGKGMTKPLRQMAAAARRLAKGDYSAQVTTNARDEVGQLARAFGSMSEQLATADRQRRDLIANVSHELRTPLTALLATLENLQDGVIQESPEVLATMHGHVERLGRLVHDLLELSRLEAGESPLRLESVELAELIDEVVDEACAHHEDAHVAVSVAPNDLVISADPMRLRQVLGNLVHNGLRHGGRNIAIAVRRDGALIRIEVADDGPGIPEAERERVFERFYRAGAARSAGGTGFGLGLSIVGWIVALHGGQVHAEANSPHGCRMIVELPDEPLPREGAPAVGAAR
jgi:signal transduction histidine kinase